MKIGLVHKLVGAIIGGILIGMYLPDGFGRIIVTMSGIFSTFLKFVVPLMILAYVTMGIANLSQGAGKTAAFDSDSGLYLNLGSRFSILYGG
jgi:Na+/H+-dicarboxylate symporter